MARGSLSKRTVDAAAPAAKDHFIWDDEVAGFGLKVTPSGGKVYIFQYRIARPGEAERTPARRYTIGRHGSPWTPDQAKKRAKELAGYVEHGIDPRQHELDELAAREEAARQETERARLESELAFSKVAALWLDHYEKEKGRRPSSVRMAKLVVDRYLKPALGQKPIPHIGRVDLQPILDGIDLSRKSMRRAVFAYASVLFGWAAKRGDISNNPLVDMAKPVAPKSRDRVLSDDELAEVWKASQSLGAPFGPFYRLLVITGQRRGEVAAMSWSELDRSVATWTIPVDRAKNGIAHIVPLNPLAIEELDRLAKVGDERDGERKAWPKTGLVFTTTGKTPISGMTKAKNALDAAIHKARCGAAELRGESHQLVERMGDWRIHDLRRTLATGFQRLGIRFEVTEATLNHISGAKAGVAGVYQRHDWRDEKRSALEAWSRHIASILAAKNEANVIPIAAGHAVR